MEKRILVVDDNAMNLKMAEFILGKGNYEVIMVESGAACLEKLETEEIDLILLDIEMPQMNGIQTLEQIRANDRYSDKKVMFLTASANDDMIVSEAERLGVVQIISKPFIPDILLGAVNKAI